MTHLKSKFILLVVILFSTFLLSSCTQQTPSKTFYTWQGIGPDKWASVWLINTFVDSKAEVRFTAVNGTIQDAIAFDIPNARYKRTNEFSTISRLIEDFKIENPAAKDIAQIIHDIEVDFWGNVTHKRSPVVEQAFRGLQMKYGREFVPQACYVAFFQNLHTLLADESNTKLSANQFSDALTPNANCEKQMVAFIHQTKPQMVEELEIRDLLQQMKEGKNIVFVDAREDGEFDEFRIPNAINLKLRDVKPEVAPLFSKADKVVTYCLKDFRGFELARALQERAKVKNLAIMKPYGINGWRELGLPVEGAKALTHDMALAQLDNCVADINACLKNN